MALVRSASGNVLVAHTAQDAFTALSASWDPARRQRAHDQRM